MLLLALLHATFFWTARAEHEGLNVTLHDARGAYDTPESECDHNPHYADRNEIWSRCHGSNDGGGPFIIHEPKGASDDEMFAVKKMQVWVRDDARHAWTKMCITFFNGVTKCTKDAEKFDYVKCTDLEFTENYRLHKVTWWTNGYDRSSIGINGLKIEWTDQAEGSGIKEYFCGSREWNQYNVQEVSDNPGQYQLAGLYGRMGFWLDQVGTLLYNPPCKILDRKIINIECVNPFGGRRRTATGSHGKCEGQWDQGSEVGETVEAICRNCDSTAPDLGCQSVFAVSKTHIIETSTTETDSVGSGLSMESTWGFEIGIKGFGSVSGSTTYGVSVTYEKSWSESKMQSDSTTVMIQSTCTQNTPGGFQTEVTAEVLMGTLTADFNVTYEVVRQCGENEIESFEATAVISDVASTDVIQKCEQTIEECTGEEPDFLCARLITEAFDERHKWQSQDGYPDNMFAPASEGGYPDFDTVTGTWPNTAVWEDYQKYFKCFKIAENDECAGLQYPDTCHVMDRCTDCQVEDRDSTCSWRDTRGGHCGGSLYGEATDAPTAKIDCLLDPSCHQIVCDNSQPWETACKKCDTVGVYIDTSSFFTSRRPDVDCGNNVAGRSAQRSMPDDCAGRSCDECRLTEMCRWSKSQGKCAEFQEVPLGDSLPANRLCVAALEQSDVDCNKVGKKCRDDSNCEWDSKAKTCTPVVAPSEAPTEPVDMCSGENGPTGKMVKRCQKCLTLEKYTSAGCVFDEDDYSCKAGGTATNPVDGAANCPTGGNLQTKTKTVTEAPPLGDCAGDPCCVLGKAQGAAIDQAPKTKLFHKPQSDEFACAATCTGPCKWWTFDRHDKTCTLWRDGRSGKKIAGPPKRAPKSGSRFISGDASCEPVAA